MMVFMYKLEISQLNLHFTGSNDNAICSMYMYIKVIWPPLKSANVYISTNSGFNAGNLIEGFFKK